MAECSKRYTSRDEVDGQMTELLCEPCLDDGKKLAAEGFCVDCSDYLCKDCFQNHCVPRPMKNHKLLDKHEMPKETPKIHKYKDEFTERCTIHSEELLKFYCKDHKQFSCFICIALKHRTCEVGFVPEMSVDIIESTEYKVFKTDIETLIKRADAIDMAANGNSHDAKRHGDRALGKVRDIREKVNKTFDKLEKQIVDEISKLRTEDQEKMTDISRRSSTISDKLHKLRRYTTDAETKNQTCKLFFETKRNKNEIGKYRNELSKLCFENKIRQTDFVPSREVSNTLSNFSLGSVAHLNSGYKCRKLPDVLSRSNINALTLVSGKIAVLCLFIDPSPIGSFLSSFAIKLKVIDKTGKILLSHNVETRLGLYVELFMSFEELSSELGRMTPVSDNKIAVKYRRFIKIFSITDAIKSDLEIETTELSYKPIAFSNNTFIAVTSTSPPAVCLVNMDGQITRTFPTEVNGKVLFDSPSSIAVHPDQTAMYMLDSGMKTVTCLTFEGEVTARYAHAHAWEPRDLVVSRDGLVYVSDSFNNTIYILSSYLEEISVIHGDQYGIESPTCLAYCGKEHKLYVVSDRQDIVMLEL